MDENRTVQTPRMDENRTVQTPRMDENRTVQTPRMDDRTVQAPRMDENRTVQTPRMDENRTVQTPRMDDRTVQAPRMDDQCQLLRCQHRVVMRHEEMVLEKEECQVPHLPHHVLVEFEVSHPLEVRTVLETAEVAVMPGCLL